MARARKMVNDQNSANVDHLTDQFNNLLLILESAAASITAGATAADVLNAISAAITAGVDSNPGSIANIQNTGRTIEGQWATPRMPRRRYMETVDLNKNSKF